MEIQKEREAFEVYLLSQGVDLKYLPCIYFNGTSYDQEDGDEDHEVALGEINLGWNAWQAAKKVAVPEVLNYKQLYKLAIINSKTDESKPNWAHVVSLGVGSGKAKEILRSFNIDPDATDMRKVIEAQEPSHD